MLENTGIARINNVYLLEYNFLILKYFIYQTRKPFFGNKINITIYNTYIILRENILRKGTQIANFLYILCLLYIIHFN